MSKKREHIVQIIEGKWYRIAHGKAPHFHYCCRCNLGHRVDYKYENGTGWERWNLLPDEPKARTKAPSKRKRA